MVPMVQLCTLPVDGLGYIDLSEELNSPLMYRRASEDWKRFLWCTMPTWYHRSAQNTKSKDGLPSALEGSPELEVLLPRGGDSGVMEAALAATEVATLDSVDSELDSAENRPV